MALNVSSPLLPLNVLQFTDTHLLGDRQARLLGLNTHESLTLVLQQAQHRHRQADLVLVTGDLVHGGLASGYVQLQEVFRSFDVPVLLLPGNHDEARQLRETTIAGPARLVSHVLRGGWQIVLLDSTIPGSDGGRLAASELALLERHLSAASGVPALVCLHHQPVPMGSDWLDGMVLENAGEFFAILDRHPQVRGVLWGHVHQEYDAMRHGVRLLATPSTCFQFKPRSSDFSLDSLAPGYRWLELHADGRIDSGVERLEGFVAGLDLQSTGY